MSRSVADCALVLDTRKGEFKECNEDVDDPNLFSGYDAQLPSSLKRSAGKLSFKDFSLAHLTVVFTWIGNDMVEEWL